MFALWLQMNRTLTIPIALLIMVVFALLETILQIRTRTADGLQFTAAPIRTRKPTPPATKPAGPPAPQPIREPKNDAEKL